MARKVIRWLNDSQKEFQKVFESICNSRSSWQVWADFVTMTAIAISNAVDQTGPQHDEREKLYLDTIRQYRPEEQQQFPKLCAITVDALEKEPNQDFLGEMFMALELSNHWTGQFFTPYNICRMMAQMTVCDGRLDDTIKARGWVGINDPACGAGALLVAVRNVMVEREMSPFTALFVAQDIDRNAALMCYIQLSLLGCAGYVVIANTITHPCTGPLLDPIKTENNDIWFTPMFHHQIWAERRIWHRMDLLIQSLAHAPVATPLPEAERAVTAPARVDTYPEPEPSLRATETGQLSLF